MTILKKNLWTFRISFLVLIMGLMIWLIVDSHQTKIKTENPNNPDAFMTQIQTTQFGKNGQLESILIGTKATHYSNDNETLFETPYFIIHSKEGPPWHIHADSGKALNGTNSIVLTGHVRINQLPGPGSRNITFETTTVTYYPDTSLAVTDQPVTILQPGSIVHAVGLQADLNKGYMKLLSHTEAQYSTKPKNSKEATTTAFKTSVR